MNIGWQTLGRTSVAVVLVCGMAGAAPAQDVPPTRQEGLQRLRAEKAGRLAPYRPGRVETWLLRVQQDGLLERLLLSSGSGWHARLGSLTSGGGLAAGPAYRDRTVWRHRLDVSAWAAVSLKRYWQLETLVAVPRLAGERAFAGAHARWRDFPQEDFFGLGPDSQRTDRVSFAYRESAAGGHAGLRLTPWISTGGGLEYLAPRVGRGRDPRLPSIEERFGDQDAPGLLSQPQFIRSHAFLDVDYSEPRGNPRAGGRYLFTLNRYSARAGGAYSFDRLEVDLRQYVSFLQQRRVLALRGFLSLSEAPAGATVPFYLQSTLGGASSLRGFREYRFRDENLLLFQGEYRWEIFPALDAALFYDAGQVAPRREDLSLRDLESNYGFGFRFGTNEGVFLRIDAAFGSREGKRYFIKLSHVF